MTDVVAALDAGTNTLRLLIAGRTGDGRLVELNRQLRFVGLGQGVSVSGRFAPDGPGVGRDRRVPFADRPPRCRPGQVCGDIGGPGCRQSG